MHGQQNINIFLWPVCLISLLSFLYILCFCIVLFTVPPFVLSSIFVHVNRPLPQSGNPIALNKLHVMPCYVKYIAGSEYMFVMHNSGFFNFEVRHPCCVVSITKNYCVLHKQSNTTIFHLVVQHVYKYMFRPYMWAIFRMWFNSQSSYTRCVGCSFPKRTPHASCIATLCML